MLTRRFGLAAAFACVAAVPAVAFRLEEADAETAAELASACERSSLHDALRTELDALREGRPLSDDLEQALQRLSFCPWCGCRLAALPASAS